MSQQPFFVSDSIKNRFDFDSNEELNENEEFLCEFQIDDEASLFFDLKEISFGSESYILFEIETFNIKELFLTKYKKINILIENQIIFEIEIKNISKTVLTKEKDKSFIKINF